jgi:hypothetical protein
LKSEKVYIQLKDRREMPSDDTDRNRQVN